MSVWNDLHLAARLLIRDRPFTLAATFALVLGIGANRLVFTLVNGLLLRDLPFDEPDRLMAIEWRDTRSNRTWNFSYPDLRDLQAAGRTFSAIAGMDQRSMRIADDVGPAERVTGAYVSANTFGLLGRQPVLGRDFRVEDDQPGAEPVVLLGSSRCSRSAQSESTVRVASYSRRTSSWGSEEVSPNGDKRAAWRISSE